MRLRDLGMTEEKWIHEGSWTIPVVGTLGCSSPRSAGSC